MPYGKRDFNKNLRNNLEIFLINYLTNIKFFLIVILEN